MERTAHIRKRLGQARRRLLQHRSPKVQDIVRSIPEALWRREIARHVDDMQVIRGAGAETYEFGINPHPAIRKEMHFARRHVYRMNNLLVHPRTGACRTDKHLFQESYGSMRRCIVENPFPPVKARRQKVCGLVTCIHATGYYHFLLEEIPRLLWVVARFPEARVLISDRAPSFARQILDMLTLNRAIRGWEIVSSRDTLLCDDYAFAQAEAYSGFIHSSDLSILLQHVCGGQSVGLNDNLRNVYISRKEASRSFDNEAYVEDMFSEQGYDVVYSERLNFHDQIALFQSARTVVAGHGAGLANLVWCQDGTRVIELFSPKYFNDCYARLSVSMNLTYQPFWAAPSGRWGSIDVSGLKKMVFGPHEAARI